MEFNEKNLITEIVGAFDLIYNNSLEKYDYLDSKEPIAFEELFLPFIYVARRKLSIHDEIICQLLTENALISLQRSLLKQLSQLASMALEVEFILFRAKKQPGIDSLLQKIQQSSSNKIYIDFINIMRHDRFALFLQEYVVLARLLAVAVDLWFESTSEFLIRLMRDLPDISSTFAKGEDIGKITRLEPNLSDRHNNGRTVIIVAFAKGVEIVYKPKDLSIETECLKVFDWFNDKAGHQIFKLYRLINRATHGWVEFIEHIPCKSIEEVKMYYYRAGNLLAMLYCLEGTDCHFENIIACGGFPVLIDFETLLHPRTKDFKRTEVITEAALIADQQIAYSVLRTAFLPDGRFIQDGKAYDISGLGAGIYGESFVHRLEWKNINTDIMKQDYNEIKHQLPKNLPFINNSFIGPNKYVEEIVTGFKQLYNLLLCQREILLSADSPFERLKGLKCRFVFRSTKIYASLLLKTLEPKYLRNEIDRSKEFDALYNRLPPENRNGSFLSIFQEEKKSMERIDIPFFSVWSDKASLIINNEQIIENFFDKTGYELVNFKINSLDEKDLEQQLALIRGSLYSRAIENQRQPYPLYGNIISRSEIVPSSKEMALKEAIAIAEEYRETAICGKDGSAVWIGIGYEPKGDYHRMKCNGYSLFDGCCGISLFLAALEKVTGGAGYKDLAMAALLPLHNYLQQSISKKNHVEYISIGGITGLGSIVYGLVRINQLLETQDLLLDAQLAASLITPELIEKDQKLNIMNGSAGTVLSLLSLFNVTHEPQILEKAIVCGNYLLNKRKVKDGYKIWDTPIRKNQSGFAFGSAGITYALVQLYKATHEANFLEAAEEALKYEKKIVFDKSTDQQFNEINWCYDISGIGYNLLRHFYPTELRDLLLLD